MEQWSGLGLVGSASPLGYPRYRGMKASCFTPFLRVPYGLGWMGAEHGWRQSRVHMHPLCHRRHTCTSTSSSYGSGLKGEWRLFRNSDCVGHFTQPEGYKSMGFAPPTTLLRCTRPARSRLAVPLLCKMFRVTGRFRGSDSCMHPATTLTSNEFLAGQSMPLGIGSESPAQECRWQQQPTVTHLPDHAPRQQG